MWIQSELLIASGVSAFASLHPPTAATNQTVVNDIQKPPILLRGGFKDFLIFTPIPGEMIQFD